MHHEWMLSTANEELKSFTMSPRSTRIHTHMDLLMQPDADSSLTGE